VGNGCHLHFSAWREGQNLMTGGPGPEELTETGEALAAGVLEHLPELMAVLAPSVLSYERLQPNHWSGSFTCWGRENREAALRFIKGTAGGRSQSANFEVKTVDSTSNPYLAAAVVIAAALAGLEQGQRLPAPTQLNPADLSAQAQAEQRIRRLPASLDEAIAEFERSSLLRQALGDPLFEAFLAVRRVEWESYGQKDAAEVIASHRWRYG
jgi:glutamine synthetase